MKLADTIGLAEDWLALSERLRQRLPSVEPSTFTGLMKLVAGLSNVTPSSGWVSPVSKVMRVVLGFSET